MNRGRSAAGIPQSKYLPRQMNGPVINAFGAAQEEENRDAEIITNYLHDLSLDTAQETELENIGLIIGYPRPIVPEGFNNENIFLFGTLPIEIDASIGFAENGSQTGGQFASTEVGDNGTKMAPASYRKMLKVMARVKRYGITIKNIDDIAREFNPDYTISWLPNGDVKLKFTNSIGYKNVWILTQLFYRVCTIPQVTVESGGN